MKTPHQFFALLLTSFAAVAEPTVTRVNDAPQDLRPLPGVFHGRAQQTGANSWKYQWPGTYAEVKFVGTEFFFTAGPEPAILRLSMVGGPVFELVGPQAGVYRVAGLAPGEHVARITSVSENQAQPITFGGFSARPPTRSLAPAPRTRQLEFIGDSHTVGYGNISSTRECTEDKVWATTDNWQAFGPVIARHYDADYQVNAISGRGVVRNYGGFKADPLPVAYPFVLFDRATPYKDSNWQPQVIVIALGTNDFSTPLGAGEPWKTRDELHADYEASYLKFLTSLRARNPHALLVLWATDMADGEIASEAKKVVDRLVASGDSQTAFVSINGLGFTACNWHPSTNDDQTIASALIKIIDGRVAGWSKH
jgi:lysophospholipase L1-like esterase